jgi:DNA-binding FadR family transcriptional regulator
VDHAAWVAPYRHVAAVLRARITSGQYGPGALIPSENQMTLEFGVSRTAIRNAVAKLRYEDWVVTVAGRGTYVADPLPGARAKPGGLGPARVPQPAGLQDATGRLGVRCAGSAAGARLMPPAGSTTSLRA